MTRRSWEMKLKLWPECIQVSQGLLGCRASFRFNIQGAMLYGVSVYCKAKSYYNGHSPWVFSNNSAQAKFSSGRWGIVL